MRASLLVALMLSACTGGLKDLPVDTDGDTAALEGALLTLSADRVDFGDVGFGDLVPATLTVGNPGTVELNISAITVESPFQVSPPTLRVLPGGSNSITLYVQPVTYGTFEGALILVTDGDAVGTVTVPLTVHTLADVDGDGYETTDAGGDDCDDSDASYYPGADDDWYDGYDKNCDGANDYDQDGDGYDASTDDHDGTDCNDIDVDYNPASVDVPYDNRDTDCDGWSDWDYDRDGYGAAEYSRGSDCDDADDRVNRDMPERFNGKDDDCNGDVDDDAGAENAEYVWDDGGGNFERTGYAMAVGDLDGDGGAEIIVGSPYVDAATGSAAGRGGVSIFRGPDLLPTGTNADDADNYFEGVSASDLLGTYLTVMGDHDGDGVPELAISATGTSGNSGTVYLLSGDEAVRPGRDTRDALVTYTGTSSSSFGRGVGTEIDLDNDGFDEFVAMYASGSSNYVGVEYGRSGPVSGSVSGFDAAWSTDGTETAFYRNAPVGGDLDGDGYEDLVLSDGAADYGTTDTGAMWVVWGQAIPYATTGAADLESTASTLVRGSVASAGFAWATQLGEDWDGDGDAELWIYNDGDGLYVVEGGPSLRSTFDVEDTAAVSYIWASNATDAEMIRRTGDWDGDGVSDMMVFFEDSTSGFGRSQLFPSSNRTGEYDEDDDSIGSLVGSNNTDTEESNGNVGYGMSPLPGDVDGDGDLDIAVGDPEWETTKGKAYVLLNQSGE